MGIHQWAILIFGFRLINISGREIEHEDWVRGELDDEVSDGEYELPSEDYRKELLKDFDGLNREFDYPSDWNNSGYCLKNSSDNIYIPEGMEIQNTDTEAGEQKFYLKIIAFQMSVHKAEEIPLEQIVNVWKKYIQNQEAILKDIETFCKIYNFEIKVPQFEIFLQCHPGKPAQQSAAIVFGFQDNDTPFLHKYNSEYLKKFRRYYSKKSDEDIKLYGHSNEKRILGINDFIIEDRSFSIYELLNQMKRFLDNEGDVQKVKNYLEEKDMEETKPKFFLLIKERNFIC